MIDRYLLFKAEKYAESCGWGDYVGSFRTLTAAEQAAHIVVDTVRYSGSPAGWYTEFPMEADMYVTTSPHVNGGPWWQAEPPADAPPRPAPHPWGGNWYWRNKIEPSSENYINDWAHIVDLETGEIVEEFDTDGWYDPRVEAGVGNSDPTPDQETP